MIIGNNCFVNTTRFIVDGLNDLESLKIGDRCFILGRWDSCNGVIGEARKGSECVIVNCPKLHQIQIGADSFADYGKMELKNLPSLQILNLGGKNFCWIESFELKGQLIEQNENLDLPSLITVTLGNCVGGVCHDAVIESNERERNDE